MFSKIISNDYYKLLLQIFSRKNILNSSLLPISNFNKSNLSFFQKAIDENSGFDIIIRVPNNFTKLLEELYSNTYLYVANKQFYENYSSPNFEINDLVIRKGDKKNRKYKIVEIKEELITLIEQKKESLKDFNGPAIIKVKSNNITKEFVTIKRGLKKGSLNNYLNLFSSLNSCNIDEDSFPTKFNKVSIFIGAKKILENFRNIQIKSGNLFNSIPCYYLNRDGKESDTLGIAPLIYFSCSYQVAYKEVLLKQIKVNNIVLFNDGFDELQQMINDQYHYGFRILGISTDLCEKRAAPIKYWEWHKEEINLIDIL